MSKTILTVHVEIPGDVVEKITFGSSRSLLDGDIIVMDLTFLREYRGSETHEGKALLSNSNSFRVLEHINHWKSEVSIALDSGKTVIVFLSKFETMFRYTGEKTFSGTGKNQKTTNIVTSISNYDVLPLTVRPVAKEGSQIRANGDLAFLAGYWREFGPSSEYEVYLEAGLDEVLLTTKGGEKPVGGLIRRGDGHLVLLPELYWNEDEFYVDDADSEGWTWSQKAIAFGNRLVKEFVQIDRSLRSDIDQSPAPEWIDDGGFSLNKEDLLVADLSTLSTQLAELELRKESLLREIVDARVFKGLLFQKGPALEKAILEALKLMGFTAVPYVDDESEFDAIFESVEGRFLGEAEGKDNKPINVDKLSQLERNIQEDFAREEVQAYAKGVLFGNAFRLTPPEERGEFFTDKCMRGAERAKVALVRTTDLFKVAQYLTSNEDLAFAKICREEMFSSEGKVVSFPVPTSARSNPKTVSGARGKKTRRS